MSNEQAMIEEMARKLAMFLFPTFGDPEGVVWAGLMEEQRDMARHAAVRAYSVVEQHRATLTKGDTDHDDR